MVAELRDLAKGHIVQVMSDFETMDDYLALPRVTDLALSPDGKRLVATIGKLNDDGNERIDALWEIDPSGAADAVQLTRSAKGESAPVFLPDGALLFVSKRDGEDDDPPSLWRLPLTGEAEQVVQRPGGVAAVVVAKDAGTVVLSGSTLPGSTDTEQDEKRRKARKDAKVRAALHAHSPVRFWDHDLGPDELRLFALENTESAPRDLTPTPGRALDEAGFAVTPDGSTVVASWNEHTEPGYPRPRLVAIDTATSARRVLAADEHAGF